MRKTFQEAWLWLNIGATCRWEPPVDLIMSQKGLIWRLVEYSDGSRQWRKVCDFCGGNCGQCGLTDTIGNIPFSLDRMVKKGNWDSGKHFGLPRY